MADAIRFTFVTGVPFVFIVMLNLPFASLIVLEIVPIVASWSATLTPGTTVRSCGLVVVPVILTNGSAVVGACSPKHVNGPRNSFSG
jgi:hypothetical protein